MKDDKDLLKKVQEITKRLRAAKDQLNYKRIPEEDYWHLGSEVWDEGVTAGILAVLRQRKKEKS